MVEIALAAADAEESLSEASSLDEGPALYATARPIARADLRRRSALI